MWRVATKARLHALRKDDADLVSRILAAIELGEDVGDLLDELQQQLDAAGKAGVEAAAVQISISDDGILEVANEKAIAYAKDRAAEMVGKKWVGDELIDNPQVEWRIDEATRDMLSGTVSTAMEEGWSNDRLASEIEDSYAFSEERAETIARTETAFADVNGNLELYRESGQVSGKRWLTAPDCCDECEELDGEVVGLDEDFPKGGGDGPPLHPNCRCDVLPELMEEGDES